MPVKYYFTHSFTALFMSCKNQNFPIKKPPFSRHNHMQQIDFMNFYGIFHIFRIFKVDTIVSLDIVVYFWLNLI